VWKPWEAAYLMSESEFFELEMLDWPVSAKRLGEACLFFGRLRCRMA